MSYVKRHTQYKIKRQRNRYFGVWYMVCRKLLCILTLCTMHYVLCTPASAQVTELTISPPVSYIQIKPGSKARHTVTVQNTGDQTVQVSTSIVDFKPSPKDGLPVLAQTNSFPYLDENSKSFPVLTIKPQERAQLTLQFTVPQFSPQKEYPLTILFSTQPTDMLQDASQAQVQNTVGSNLIVLVSSQNDLEQKLIISDFAIPKIVDSFNPLSISPVVKNELVSASIASGSATLKNAFGKTVAEYTIYPDVILGQSERRLRFTKISNLDNIETLDAKPFAYDPVILFGPYTLFIQFTPTTSIPYSATFAYTFFALPLLLLLILVLIVVFTIIAWKKRLMAKNG